MPRTPAPTAPPNLTADVVVDVAVPADVYAAGDVSVSIPLAGLLASDATLADAQLTADEWAQRLTDYAETQRP